MAGMHSKQPLVIIFTAVVLFCAGTLEAASDSVLLQDVNVLTLKEGMMTNARRTSPVPQLKCVGGTAGCHGVTPKVVQCYNRGWDGYDVQWECKADLDNSYKFGQLEVNCEGYQYPDDRYILRGSCGLEYTLDLTEEGRQRQQHGGGGWNDRHHSDYHDRSAYTSYFDQGYGRKAKSIFGDLVFLCVFALIIYVIYKSCIAAPDSATPPGDSYAAGDHPRGSPPPYERSPPPYGFREEYMPNSGQGCSYGNSSSYTGSTQGSGTGGGFWSGMFTGGLMGYLFGNRNSYTYYDNPHAYQHRGWGWNRPWGSRWGNGWGSGWGNGWGSGWGNSWGSNGFSSRTTTSTPRAPSSSGSRTASGFGGTRRR